MIGRAGREKNLIQYRDAMELFSRESGFTKFWNKQANFYRQTIDMTIAEIGKMDLVQNLEDYFNET